MLNILDIFPQWFVLGGDPTRCHGPRPQALRALYDQKQEGAGLE